MSQFLPAKSLKVTVVLDLAGATATDGPPTCGVAAVAAISSLADAAFDADRPAFS